MTEQPTREDNLVARIQFLRQLHAEVVSLQKTKANRQTLAENRSELRKLRISVSGIMRSFDVVQEVHEGSQDSLRSVRLRLRELQDEVKQMEEEFEEHNAHDLTRQVKPLISRCESINNELSRLWSDVCGSRIRTIGSRYELVKPLIPLSHETDQMMETLQNLKTSTPTKEASGRIQSVFAQLDQTIIAIENGLPDFAHDFLQRVKDGSATLADVTPDILAWCRETQSLYLFSIRLD